MNTLPYQSDIAARMNVDALHDIPEHAQFYHTQNGYWIAWFAPIAAVLPPNLPKNEPCDWIEEADDLTQWVDLIESGEYESLLNEEHSCNCGCTHEHNASGSLK